MKGGATVCLKLLLRERNHPNVTAHKQTRAGSGVHLLT